MLTRLCCRLPSGLWLANAFIEGRDQPFQITSSLRASYTLPLSAKPFFQRAIQRHDESDHAVDLLGALFLVGLNVPGGVGSDEHFLVGIGKPRGLPWVAWKMCIINIGGGWCIVDCFHEWEAYDDVLSWGSHHDRICKRCGKIEFDYVEKEEISDEKPERDNPSGYDGWGWKDDD